MNQPIYVYYQLDNFYQNHRRYVKSQNDQQLRDSSKANETNYCDPEKTTPDGSPIVHCGLIAWSLLNDTYSFTRGNKNLTVNKKDISWKSDRDHKFGKDVFPKNFQNGTLIGGGKLDPNKSLSEQEDLIVWMRTAVLPTFRKFYGRIEVDLKEYDTIMATLENNYKRTVSMARRSWCFRPQAGLEERMTYSALHTSLWVDSASFWRHHLLSWSLRPAFSFIASVCRKLGDPSYLSWNRNPSGR
uniref:ALA-interacting subunit n=1 Tax=Ananas comosus var. bracteatus TaxID=296719 RepID=A0A6V7PM63_ANACO|nr:unnamed protein product [Ananas comosus var. bracteatus]